MADRNGLPPQTGQVQLHTVRIENVEDGEVKLVRCLSASYGGIGTHYVKGQSRYCASETCRTDWHRTEWYYRGYFAAEWFCDVRKLWLPCVWELTEQSELDVRGRYQRGQVWEFSRVLAERKGHAPTVAKLMGSYPENLMPSAWDYRPVLMRVYHAAAIDTSIVNPMPPRLLLAPSPATAGFEAVGEYVKTTDNPRAAEQAEFRRHYAAARNGTHK